MIASKLKKNELDDLLNQKMQSRDGVEFYPSEDKWKLSHKSSKIPITGSDIAFEEQVLPYYRLALARYANNKSVDSVSNIVNYLKSLVNLNNGNWITNEVSFLNLKNKLGKKDEYKLSTARGFFKYWFESGLWGIEKEFIDAVYKVKLKGNTKGEAVLKNNPLKGPFTPLELQSIIDSVNNLFLDNKINIESWVVIQLFAQRGLRTAQLTQLAFCDFTNEGGRFFINQPRSKQRDMGFRERFTRYEISEDLYNGINALKQERIDEINKITQKGFCNNIKTFPLLPINEIFIDCISHKKEIGALCFKKKWDVKYILEKVNNKISSHALSERTGEPIHLSSKRFRLTMATDLAREGAGVGVIASALDHTDNQNAGVYVKTSADIATRLNQKIGKMLAPLAQAFAGHIILDESQANRGTDPTSRIRSINGEKNVGSCGNHAFCNANAPVSCYTCIKFQPWLDAPHEDVLTDLYNERDLILTTTGNETIASILDRAILAVEDVVRLCEEKKSNE